MGTPSQAPAEISISGGHAEQRPFRSGDLVIDFHSAICGTGRTPANAHRRTTIRHRPILQGSARAQRRRLIDTYHQAADDLRAAQDEGSDNLCKAHALTLATEKAMRDRFPDYRARYKMRYPRTNSPASPFRRTRSWRRQSAGFPITIRPGKSVIRTAVRKGRTQ